MNTQSSPTFIHESSPQMVYKQQEMLLESPLSIKKPFPFRLYAMLEYVTNSEHSSAIQWTHNGLAFVIIQKDVIVEHILPLFSNQTMFPSFVSVSHILASELLALEI